MDSIAANIAKGYVRATRADRKHFYLYARSSLQKTNYWLHKLIRRGIVTDPVRIEQNKQLVGQLGCTLNVFIKTT